ncbi:MAG: transcription elongation factor GreB [Myxococcales bacterium]|nr:transcription elongation factor GreB [Myxococcales bacterium]
MSVRDRTPRPPTAKYITPEGAKRLREELEWLWTKERPRVTQAVSDAAALGDRSENADYIYGKRRLREIDRRIEYLAKRLDVVTVVTETPRDRGRVAFGAWITLEDDDGGEQVYRLVGPDEFDPKQGFISVDSPVAKAVLGKRAGDEVTVARPKGAATFTIVGVRYREA